MSPPATPPTPAVSGGPDPFDEILKDLQAALAQVQSLDKPLADAAGIVGDVLAALDTADDLISILEDLTTLCQIISETLPALTEIPVVGEIADVAEPVFTDAGALLSKVETPFKQAKTEVIDKARPPLTDIGKGLFRFQEVVHTVSTTVPDAINTIRVLSYLVSAARVLLPYLKESPAEARVAAFVGTLDSIRHKVADAAKPMTAGLEAVAAGTAWVANELDGPLKTIRQDLETHHGAMGAIILIVKPAGDAFQAAERRIAPIRWVLEAAQWFMDHVLQPVIDWISHTLGLDKLFEPVKEQLAASLGFEGVATDLKATLHPDAASANTKNAGASKAADTAQSVHTFVVLLQQYRQDHNAGLRKAGADLLAAVTGAPLDSNKPWVLPPWPKRPGIPAADAPVTGARAPLVRSRSLAQLRAHNDSLLQAVGPVLLAAAPAQPPPLDDLSDVLIDDLGSEWEPVRQLVGAIQKEAGDLRNCSNVADQVQAALSAFEAQLPFPAAFAKIMEDLSAMFDAASQLLLSVARQKVLSKTLTDVARNVSSQAKAAKALELAAVSLPAKAAPVEKALATVLARAGGAAHSARTSDRDPISSVVTTALATHASWASGAAHLAHAVKAARSSDVRLLHAADLDRLQQQINAASGVLTGQVKRLQDQANAVEAASACVLAELATFAKDAAALHGHASHIHETAMPALERTTRLISTVDAFIDPLSGLLDALGCSPGGPKGAAALEVKTFCGLAVTTIQQYAEGAVRECDAISEQLLPLAGITADVTKTAGSFASTTFQKDATSLGDALERLAAACQTDVSYPMVIPSKDGKPARTVRLVNPLVDENLATEAVRVFRAVAADYPSATGAPAGGV